MRKTHFCDQPATCSHIRAIETYCNGKTLSDAVVHLDIFRHYRKECRYGPGCYSYKRNEDRKSLQGNQQDPFPDKAEYDKGHCLRYHHQEDRKQYEDPNFRDFQPIPGPTATIVLTWSNLILEDEIHRNGFGDVLKTPNGESLVIVAYKKSRHPIHLALGLPLCEQEILAVLLYTGSCIQPDFNQCNREGNFQKWPALMFWYGVR